MACRTDINEYKIFNFKAVMENGEVIKINRLAKTADEALKSAKNICTFLEWKMYGMFDEGEKCDRILYADNCLCKV